MVNAGGAWAVKDAALIAAAQGVAHYKVSAYGTARAFAQYLGHEEAARLLQETLIEEAARDRWLTRLARLRLPIWRRVWLHGLAGVGLDGLAGLTRLARIRLGRLPGLTSTSSSGGTPTA